MATLTTQGDLTNSVLAVAKYFESLCSKLEELNRLIKQEEVEKDQLQHDISLLTEKLIRINKSLPQRWWSRAELQRTIAEIEATCGKLLQNWQSNLCDREEETGEPTRAKRPRRMES